MDKCRILKRRLEESEENRRSLQDRMIGIQEEWDSKLSEHSSSLAHKHQYKIETLENQVQEQIAEIESLKKQLSKNTSEKNQLTSKLTETNRKNEEGGSENENFILRRQMDNLLKEKISLSAENSQLRKRLNNLEEIQFGSYNEGRSSSINTSSNNKSRSVNKDMLTQNSPLKPMNADDIELRNKVNAYFAKRYPKVNVTQMNRSRIYVMQQTSWLAVRNFH
jgi:chromosome segregation ATPase